MIETTPYDEKLKPLFGAIEVGNIEQVKAWIAAGEPLLNPKSRSPSALVVAAEAGFFQWWSFFCRLMGGLSIRGC